MKKVISIVISIVLVLLMAVSIFMFVRHYSEKKKVADAYSDMLDFVVTESADETESTEPTETDTNLETEPTQEDLSITVDFEELLAQYPNAVGWLYCEGTPINYPVMQSDDNDYYLRRLPDGTYNTAGSLFADYRCGKLGESNNYIIYGHNMKNGTMFSCLTKYKSQPYYDEHPVLYLYTPEGNYQIELIAGFVSKPTRGIYNTNQTYEQILRYCSNYTFRSDVAPCEGDCYITLSTCSYEYENARYIVVGRLVENRSR